MDPHFCKTHELSTKSDVYALGVVLLEVLCGRRSLDFEVAHRQERLVLWAEQCFRERIVDPGLRGSLAYDVLRIFLDITLKCLQDHPKKRPPLADVVAKLEIALESTYSSSSSVDSGIFKHFNQVAYSSASANSDADPSRHTVETGSTKSDTIKQACLLSSWSTFTLHAMTTRIFYPKLVKIFFLSIGGLQECFQEYCIRHVDGTAVKSDGERQRIIQCIKAAIERRVSEGLMLELRTLDRVSLLSDATRIFRENSLTITRADVETKGDTVVGTFYVCDASGIRLIPRLLIQLGGKSGREISM
ncbi:hypothetical protein L1987_61682 [Smallanthus sonchifolius]|uniref:Uncharacterized protein n=1 Tax=Smallanthus sonchifolius TaxID=185202 RepID=A0ACB9C8L4_9ASTR|nr:hypothetical protein L1987_61682 [Smallanthus sonchifolius]